jgi:hypothetical protein
MNPLGIWGGTDRARTRGTDDEIDELLEHGASRQSAGLHTLHGGRAASSRSSTTTRAGVPLPAPSSARNYAAPPARWRTPGPEGSFAEPPQICLTRSGRGEEWRWAETGVARAVAATVWRGSTRVGRRGAERGVDHAGASAAQGEGGMEQLGFWGAARTVLQFAENWWTFLQKCQAGCGCTRCSTRTPWIAPVRAKPGSF